MEQESTKLGVAFALVIVAGLCAPLGASVVVFMKKTHTGMLVASIALAAGVMLFISLTEVLPDSLEQLKQKNWGTALTHTYTYLCFFGGVILCRALDWCADGLLHLLSKASSRTASWASRSSSTRGSMGSAGGLSDQQLCSIEVRDETGQSSSVLSNQAASLPKASCEDLEEGPHSVDLVTTVSTAPAAAAAARVHGGPQPHAVTCNKEDPLANTPLDDKHEHELLAAVEQLGDKHRGHLVRTSVLIWLALSLHNIPEGLATMVGYLSSPHLGVTVAVAIAIHNIPEGIALGVPLFFATGSKWKAIGWAAASGLAEPLGALIGLALQLTGHLSPVAMGFIMAGVAGVMTGIALQELLPRALSFDTENKHTSYGVFGGMGIMAMSLVLLSLWDPSM